MSCIRVRRTCDLSMSRAGNAQDIIGVTNGDSAVEPMRVPLVRVASSGKKIFLASLAGSRSRLPASPPHDELSRIVIRPFRASARQRAQDGACGVVFSDDGSRRTLIVSIVWLHETNL